MQLAKAPPSADIKLKEASMDILICDDDSDIVDAIAIYLKNDGYRVHKAYNGLEALTILQREDIHLIILDWMMPVLDGIKTLHQIREFSNLPVIMLTAKSEDTDTITGLTLGADDYITKPFKPLELLARVKSQLRRYTNLGHYVPKDNQYKSGGLLLDDDSKSVTVDGDPVKLTRYEYQIVKLLLESSGKVYSIDQIYESVWEEPNFKSDNTVAVHIRRIREKIEINPKEPKYLKVVWGIGYKIEKYE